MTALLFANLTQKLSPLVLASLGIVALSSCARAEVANPQSAGGNKLATLQDHLTNQASAPQNAAPQPGILSPSVEAEPAVASSTTALADTSIALSSSPGQTAAADAPDIEIGLPYIEARTRLIQQGWVPVVAAEPGPYGVERELYDMGITEVSACSGTGVGACRFEFSHPGRTNSAEGSELSVITYGGSRTEVADWELSNAAPITKSMAVQPLEVPALFQGLWNANPDQCAVPYSDGKLLVEPNRLTFYESSGPVVKVAAKGASEVMLTTEISGEGMTSLETYTLQLSEDGSSLDVNGFVRSRC